MKVRFAIIGFLFSLHALVASSQNPHFAIEGTVRDATTSVLPGATVTIHQADSGQGLSATTDAKGDFELVLPALGSYQIAVEDPGFSPYTTSVTVSESAPTATLDIALEIATATQTIEVTADALAAETTSTQLGENLDTRKIESVPLNGRNFTDLIAVQPGIVPQNTAQPGAVIMTGVASTPPSGDANPGNLSISGQRESSMGSA